MTFADHIAECYFYFYLVLTPVALGSHDSCQTGDAVTLKSGSGT